jgi:hypothetical protein
MTLDITTSGYNSYHPEQGPNYQVHHYMPVPPAAYNALSWRRWLFDQLLLVERHECMEFFTLKPMAQGEHWERPYAPHHGLGEDPYIVHEQGSEEAVRTNFKGQVKE